MYTYICPTLYPRQTHHSKHGQNDSLKKRVQMVLRATGSSHVRESSQQISPTRFESLVRCRTRRNQMVVGCSELPHGYPLPRD